MVQGQQTHLLAVSRGPGEQWRWPDLGTGTRRRDYLKPEPIHRLPVSRKATLSRCPQVFPHLPVAPHSLAAHSVLPGGPAGSSPQLTGLPGLAGAPSCQLHGTHHG